MLVHFVGIQHGDRTVELEKEIMSEWIAKIDQHPDEWQVPVETTHSPKERLSIWGTLKEARDVLDTVYVRLPTRLGPDEDAKRAMGELELAIEELAYDLEHLNKCMEEIAEALRAAKNVEGETESGSYLKPHAYENDEALTESAVDGKIILGSKKCN